MAADVATAIWEAMAELQKSPGAGAQAAALAALLSAAAVTASTTGGTSAAPRGLPFANVSSPLTGKYPRELDAAADYSMLAALPGARLEAGRHVYPDGKGGEIFSQLFPHDATPGATHGQHSCGALKLSVPKAELAWLRREVAAIAPTRALALNLLARRGVHELMRLH